MVRTDTTSRPPGHRRQSIALAVNPLVEGNPSFAAGFKLSKALGLKVHFGPVAIAANPTRHQRQFRSLSVPGGTARVPAQEGLASSA